MKAWCHIGSIPWIAPFVCVCVLPCRSVTSLSHLPNHITVEEQVQFPCLMRFKKGSWWQWLPKSGLKLSKGPGRRETRNFDRKRIMGKHREIVQLIFSVLCSFIVFFVLFLLQKAREWVLTLKHPLAFITIAISLNYCRFIRSRVVGVHHDRHGMHSANWQIDI